MVTDAPLFTNNWQMFSSPRQQALKQQHTTASWMIQSGFQERRSNLNSLSATQLSGDWSGRFRHATFQ